MDVSKEIEKEVLWILNDIQSIIENKRNKRNKNEIKESKTKEKKI